jgi:hypothetical protein
MRKVWMLLGLVVVVVPLVAVGCGGDDDEDAATEAPSKGEFIKQADQICAQGDKEIEQAAGDVFGQGQQPSQQEEDRFITKTVIPNVQQQVDDVRALTPPEGDEQQVAAILDSAQKGIDAVEEDPSVLTRGGGDPFAESDRLASDYGLKECGGG